MVAVACFLPGRAKDLSALPRVNILPLTLTLDVARCTSLQHLYLLDDGCDFAAETYQIVKTIFAVRWEYSYMYKTFVQKMYSIKLSRNANLRKYVRFFRFSQQIKTLNIVLKVKFTSFIVRFVAEGSRFECLIFCNQKSDNRDWKVLKFCFLWGFYCSS